MPSLRRTHRRELSLSKSFLRAVRNKFDMTSKRCADLRDDPV
jgi:hypothetical protein